MTELTLEQKLQKVLDYQEIQNLMGRHEYYHTAGLHEEEFGALFAQKTPGVSFTENNEAWIGYDSVKKCYVEGCEILGRATLKEMRKLFPDIEDKEENYNIGSMSMHTLTTPVIEIAGDGKTAKGVWISPGHITAVINGKLQACWVWEKYGVDFVKEDGKWKIWHMHMYTDIMTPYEQSWVESSQHRPPQAEFVSKYPEGFPKADMRGVFYEEYSPRSVPKYNPVPPEPYETFNEKDAY